MEAAKSGPYLSEWSIKETNVTNRKNKLDGARMFAYDQLNVQAGSLGL